LFVSGDGGFLGHRHAAIFGIFKCKIFDGYPILSHEDGDFLGHRHAAIFGVFLTDIPSYPTRMEAFCDTAMQPYFVVLVIMMDILFYPILSHEDGDFLGHRHAAIFGVFLTDIPSYPTRMEAFCYTAMQPYFVVLVIMMDILSYPIPRGWRLFGTPLCSHIRLDKSGKNG